MLTSSTYFVLAAVFQAVFGRHFGIYRKPKHSFAAIRHRHRATLIPTFCWHPPLDVDLDKCCATPNLFSDKVMESCGFEKPPVNSAGKPVKHKGPKSILPYCRDGLCLMTNANLTLPNSAVDFKKLSAYIDQWAVANPEFTQIIMDIKPVCAVEELRKKSKPRLCDHDRIYICLNSHLLWNCKIKHFKECDQLKVFMEACRSFYEQPRKKILD